MAIEIVDLPIRNGDFTYSYVSLPEGKSPVLRMKFQFLSGIPDQKGLVFSGPHF